MRECKQCHAAYKPRVHNSIYCSPRCNQLAYQRRKAAGQPRRNPRLLACERCGTQVQTSCATRRFCSRRCVDATRYAERWLGLRNRREHRTSRVTARGLAYLEAGLLFGRAPLSARQLAERVAVSLGKPAGSGRTTAHETLKTWRAR